MKVNLLLGLAAMLVAAVSIGASTAGASTSPYVCAYSTHLGVGKVTMALAITPRYVGPAMCRVFNRSFGGTRNLAGSWGRPYCSFTYSHAGTRELAEVRASRRIAGRAFCASMAAAAPKGWHKLS